MRKGLLMASLVLAGAALAADAAPEATVNGLVTYLLGKKTDIVKDKPAQEKFLSAALRGKLSDTNAVITKSANCPDAGPDTNIDNGTLLQAWDPPEACPVTSPADPAQPATQIDVMCRWGKGSQYPGTTRRMRYFLVREKDRWVVDDIRSMATEYNKESSVTDDLASLKKEAETVFASCKKKP